MNVVSLFDGISGCSVALDRLNIKTNKFYSSEVCKHALKISNNNYPDHIRLGDVTKINWVNINDIHLLIGGSPCQNLSFAGSMDGMITINNVDILDYDTYLKYKKDGFKFKGYSYLFWEYVRALKEIRPKYFLLENVNMPNKWRNLFSKILGVEPIKLNSNLVSAQNRNRLYWTNIPFTPVIDRQIEFGSILDILPFREFKPFMYSSYRGVRQIDYNKTMNSYKSHTVTTSNTHSMQYILNHNKTKMRTLSVNEYERLQTYPTNYTVGVANTNRFKCIGNSFTVDAIVELLKNLPLK